jgi:hypothetical protein
MFFVIYPSENTSLKMATICGRKCFQQKSHISSYALVGFILIKISILIHIICTAVYYTVLQITLQVYNGLIRGRNM